MSALKTTSLHSSTREVSSLEAHEREAMHALMTEYYEAVPAALFESDLARKDEVLMLHDGRGKLRGFTTVAWNPAGKFHEGDVLFSGDTIIDRECWGGQELVRAFCRRAGEWQALHQRRLFWFLLSKGHRTYLYLPLFSKCFHPSPDREESMLQNLAARVASAMFGDAWDPQAGVVRYPASHGHLRDELAADTIKRGGSPWVRFFMERNPDFDRGDELVCLTEMSADNLKRAAFTEFLKGGSCER